MISLYNSVKNDFNVKPHDSILGAHLASRVHVDLFK